MPDSNVFSTLEKKISENDGLELEEVERPRRKPRTYNMNKYKKLVFI